MTIPEAARNGVFPPPKATFWSPSQMVSWPVVKFIPAKHASRLPPKQVLIPQMGVDCMNAMGTPEATRLQVPLILAWVHATTLDT